ncbi:ATP-binding protein [Chitinophaga sedimenti]|uniref:ATP-binding protein n=1 Tax=Chitinophaga sedimenti TaxID=2033606 RepID=UPI002005D63C|nr:ATP-binding protein [Chitinophaga sedimenti]MCK7559362.1 ATP-binding protein [Chitinophaga sedimenti]
MAAALPGEYIKKGQNVAITGATGCGKSYLACALGNQACELGYKVTYYPMQRFVGNIHSSNADGSYMSFVNKLSKTNVLILDDFLMERLEPVASVALVNILEDRYERGATILTSQLPVSKWYEQITNTTHADAIMDRLMAGMNRIELIGESLRNKQ